MAVLVGGTEKQIGLALSGGRFRAAAFYLGAFRKLYVPGLPEKTDLPTCVNEGSIIGGFFAPYWTKADVLDQLEHHFTTRSIAVTHVLSGISNQNKTFKKLQRENRPALGDCKSLPKRSRPKSNNVST